MKLVLAEPRLLKEGINIISELVNDVRIKLDSNKLEIVAMDPANVAMVVFNLLSSAFVEYDVKDEESFAINLDLFRQILGRAKPSDSIIMELDEGKNKLKVDLKGEINRSFNIGLIDLQDKAQNVPDLNFAASVEIAAHFFSDAVDDMGIVADSISLVADGDIFVLESSGNVSDARFEVRRSEENKFKFDNDKITKAKYSAEYLKKIVKGARLADNVSIKFSDDYPLQVEYRVTDKLHLMTILAPRVENK
ncbi:MAG: proliferating cell nuclear antigen (pcna) [Candidatus Woesearchaeota archaeon]